MLYDKTHANANRITHATFRRAMARVAVAALPDTLAPHTASDAVAANAEGANAAPRSADSALVGHARHAVTNFGGDVFPLDASPQHTMRPPRCTSSPLAANAVSSVPSVPLYKFSPCALSSVTAHA